MGALYVGLDVTGDINLLKDQIRAVKVGDTGYYYVLNAAPGAGYGDLILHPARGGANILASRGADGRMFIKEILEKKNGTISYEWQNPGETRARTKFVAYTHGKEWNWVIAGGTYSDEITAAATTLRNRFIVIGLPALAVLAAVVWYIMRVTVSAA